MSRIQRTRRRATILLKWVWRSYRALGVFATCPVILGIMLLCMAALIMQTYFALTGETVVAQVVMSPIQTDATGSYIDIEFTPYQHQSAFSFAVDTALNDDAAVESPPLGEPTVYRIYGDTVAIRGPFMALHNGWRILGFNNIYKLALIEGEYRLRDTASTGEGTEIYINGGFEDFWWDLNDRETSFPFDMFVKDITIEGGEEFGFFNQNELRRYNIVVTANNITWRRVE